MKTKAMIVCLFLGLFVSLSAKMPDKEHGVAKSSQLDGIVTWTPYISADAAGNFVVTWAAEDDATSTNDIYAQRFSSDGTAQGEPFRVNEVDGTYYIWSEHAICSDYAGNFVVVWADERNGGENRLHSVYGQRYASDGTPIGNNFRVNDDSGAGSARWPSISCDSQGNFVVVWVDQRTFEYEIHAQRFSSDGTPQGGNFKVNEDNPFSTSVPCVSMNSSGMFSSFRPADRSRRPRRMKSTLTSAQSCSRHCLGQTAKTATTPRSAILQALCRARLSAMRRSERNQTNGRIARRTPTAPESRHVLNCGLSSKARVNEKQEQKFVMS